MVLTLVGLVLHVWLSPKLHASTDWPLSWLHRVSHWPHPRAQEIVLLAGFSGLVYFAIETNGFRSVRHRSRTPLNIFLWVATIGLIPVILALMVGLLAASVFLLAVAAVCLFVFGVLKAAFE